MPYSFEQGGNFFVPCLLWHRFSVHSHIRRTSQLNGILRQAKGTREGWPNQSRIPQKRARVTKRERESNFWNLFAELMVGLMVGNVLLPAITNFGFCFLLTAESQVGYTPWGRPGAGAPLRTRSGKLAADYRARQVFKCSNGRMMYMDWGARYVSLWSQGGEGEHNDSILNTDRTKKGVLLQRENPNISSSQYWKKSLILVWTCFS